VLRLNPILGITLKNYNTLARGKSFTRNSLFLKH